MNFVAYELYVKIKSIKTNVMSDLKASTIKKSYYF